MRASCAQAEPSAVEPTAKDRGTSPIPSYAVLLKAMRTRSCIWPPLCLVVLTLLVPLAAGIRDVHEQLSHTVQQSVFSSFYADSEHTCSAQAVEMLLYGGCQLLQL